MTGLWIAVAACGGDGAHMEHGAAHLGVSCSSDSEIGNGRGRFSELRTEMSSAMSSTCPVGILSFTSFRDCSVPVMETTHSWRSVSPTCVTSAFAVSETTCSIPVWSRMSKNSSPPRFLYLSTQPQTVIISPTSEDLKLPHSWLLQHQPRFFY